MRLTLRTLLAWMDDTLPPSEVKQIGQLVKESPFATRLVEKIRKVTRRRRLTVPSSSGPDATDPNLVAAYLDNELDAEQVEKFEKLCLTSEVHLAEVASSHQILSMIRHKAKVPAEARYRMYRLIRGREAVRQTGRGEPEPVGIAGPPLPPWAPTEPAPVSLWARFGPPAAVAGLIGLLLWAGWLNLRSPSGSPIESDRLARADQAGPVVGPPAAEPGGQGIDKAVPAPLSDRLPPLEPSPPPAEMQPEAPAAEEVAAPAEGVAALEPEAAPAQPADDAPPPVAAPAEVVGSVGIGDDLVLRYDDAERTWERLRNGAELKSGDRLVHLAPLRSNLKIGPIQAQLVGESEVVLGVPSDGESCRIDLLRGRIVLQDGGPGGGQDGASGPRIALGFGSKLFRVELPAGQPVGFEARGQRMPGSNSGAMSLGVFVPEGQAVITPDPTLESEAMQGPALKVFDALGTAGPAQAQVPPRWVTDKNPTPAEQRAGEAFLTLFGDGTTEFSLLEGVSDPRPEVQALSVAALGATGNDELVMPLLSRPDSPAIRQAALSVLQSRLAERPGALEALRPLLDQFSETPEVAAELEWLLIGFKAEEQTQRGTFERLIRDLQSTNASVRELAILHLQGLTRRDAQGYDPDKPGSGLKIWQDLFREGKIGPASSPNPPSGATRRTPSPG